MTKKILIGLGILCFGIFVSSFLKPVPIVTEAEAIIETGTIATVYEGSSYDVFLKLENSDRRYYINRGLERGLELEDLKEKLIGQEVTLKYPDYWTPLDWNNATRHLSKVEVGVEVIFDEFR